MEAPARTVRRRQPRWVCLQREPFKLHSAFWWKKKNEKNHLDTVITIHRILRLSAWRQISEKNLRSRRCDNYYGRRAHGEPKAEPAAPARAIIIIIRCSGLKRTSLSDLVSSRAKFKRRWRDANRFMFLSNGRNVERCLEIERTRDDVEEAERFSTETFFIKTFSTKYGDVRKK